MPRSDAEVERSLRRCFDLGPDAFLALARWLAPQAHRRFEAEHYHRRAVEAGHPDGLLELANFLLRWTDRRAEAETYLRRAAEDGDAWALLGLGDLYRARNQPAEAERCYRLAQESGRVNAAGHLARMLDAIPGREAEAEYWYRRLLKHGRQEEG
ncbi:MAG: hypothetical protein HOW97_40510 [Catenulispora sp.]|nr:hypothetical protein [Catenulispora sp.]